MESNARITGFVKWFNNKNGYGFITVVDETSDQKGTEVFVHYTSIRVTNGDTKQYRYLVTGEYVEFTLAKANNEAHEFQAVDVTGVKGGPIMCERHQIRYQTKGPKPDEGDKSGYQVVRKKSQARTKPSTVKKDS